MPAYSIWRLKESQRQQFRWAPHTIGVTQVKPRDYEQGESLEAENGYALWSELRETDGALRVGDLLEAEGSDLRIFKYVGFEEARWVLPEVKSGLESEPLAVGLPQEAISGA